MYHLISIYLYNLISVFLYHLIYITCIIRYLYSCIIAQQHATSRKKCILMYLCILVILNCVLLERQEVNNPHIHLCTYASSYANIKLSRHMGKPTICIGENKGADQLRGSREADQRLCFRYSDSTLPPLLNSKISSS